MDYYDVMCMPSDELAKFNKEVLKELDKLIATYKDAAKHDQQVATSKEWYRWLFERS